MGERGLAIVTGAGKGIGACVAKGLAEDGYRVVLVGRTEASLLAVAEHMQEHACLREPIVLASDITKHQELSSSITELHGMYGPIDVLVNGAALNLNGSLDAPVEDYRRLLETNLVAQYSLLRTVVPLMVAQGDGYIFNIASRAGTYGFPGGGAYGSSKFALVGLSESLCRELAPSGVRVTSLCPGWVNTEMAQDALTPLSDDQMIQPEDLLRTVRYLLGMSKQVRVREIVIEMAKSLV